MKMRYAIIMTSYRFREFFSILSGKIYEHEKTDSKNNVLMDLMSHPLYWSTGTFSNQITKYFSIEMIRHIFFTSSYKNRSRKILNIQLLFRRYSLFSYKNKTYKFCANIFSIWFLFIQNNCTKSSILLVFKCLFLDPKTTI